MSRWIATCVLAACSAPLAPQVETPDAVRPPSIFRIEDGHLGPITPESRASLTALRELVGPGGYAVRPINDGGVEFHVYDGTEHLFYVIPNDDGSLFNVHIVSGSIPITQHPEWVIGMPFSHSELLTDCESWGKHPVCWRKGDHVALGFRVSPDGLTSEEGRRALEGVRIQRAVWNPKVFNAVGDEPDQRELPDWVPQPWDGR